MRAPRFDAAGHLVGVACGDEDRRAEFQKFFGDGESDAARRSGDERGFTLPTTSVGSWGRLARITPIDKRV